MGRLVYDFYRITDGEIGIVEAGRSEGREGGDHLAWKSGRGSDERADPERALFSVPVPFDGGVLRVGEPSRLRAVDARAVSGGDGARDEVLRLHPRAQRSGRSEGDRRTHGRVRLAAGGL